LRFRSKGPGRGQWLAREQRRITLVIVGIGVIALVFVSSGRFSRFLQDNDARPAAAGQTLPKIGDNLLGEPDLMPDEINVVPNEPTDAARDYAKMIDRAGAAAMEQPPGDATSATGSLDVPQKLTQAIRDDVLGILSTETEAWFGTLKLAERIRPNLNLPEAQYALLMDSPQSCRGKPYVVRGRLRRLLRAPLPENAETFGVRTVYDAWISTRDSGNELVHVVALSADPGLPKVEHTGKNPPDVELIGYFFKREGYQTRGADGQGDLGMAPLLLCGRIRHLAPREVVSRADEMNPWLMWIGVGVGFAILLLMWQFQMSDSIFRGTRTHQLANPPVRPSFDGVESLTVQEALHDMEMHAKQTSPDTSLTVANLHADE
jgi:hypothetical protein